MYLTQTNCSNTPILTTNQILSEIHHIVSATDLMIGLVGTQNTSTPGQHIPSCCGTGGLSRSWKAIGVVKDYNEERRNLCENPWAPFASSQGSNLHLA